MLILAFASSSSSSFKEAGSSSLTNLRPKEAAAAVVDVASEVARG